MISVQNLTKKYGEKIAVNNISFSVKPGEIFGFLGPNGAGKSTTIKMIVGMLKADSGEITINGTSVFQNPLDTKRMIAYVPDNPETYENMSGRQFARFIANVFGISNAEFEENLNTFATAFEFTKDLDSPISSYSHGMKQKIVLISALVHKPKVLILDEPMVGLDAKAAFTLKELMREHCKQGGTVFFSTHVMEVAEKLCDRVAIIKSGQIIAEGTIEELKESVKNDNSFEQVFLELTE